MNLTRLPKRRKRPMCGAILSIPSSAGDESFKWRHSKSRAEFTQKNHGNSKAVFVHTGASRRQNALEGMARRRFVTPRNWHRRKKLLCSQKKAPSVPLPASAFALKGHKGELSQGL